jgi:hypothetical protein
MIVGSTLFRQEGHHGFDHFLLAVESVGPFLRSPVSMIIELYVQLRMPFLEPLIFTIANFISDRSAV